MTLTQLRYIVAIVDAGLNITAAAELVHATQPTISKQLKQLEGELGFQLFVRKGKSLATITPAGRQVIDMARAIVAQARGLRSLAANLRGERRGELTIATTHTQARFVLPGPLREFNRKCPAVAVHLRPLADQDVVPDVTDGRADLAIISSSGDLVPTGGLAIPIYRWSRLIVVPRAHPLARLRRPLQLADLAPEPLVSYDSCLRGDSSLQRAFRAAGHTPRLACTSADADLIKTYARAGLGVGILAEMAWQDGDAEDLALLDGASLLPACTTWLVLRRDRVVRGYTHDLLRQLLPRVHVGRVRAALADAGLAPDWGPVPAWSELRGDAPWAATGAACGRPARVCASA